MMAALRKIFRDLLDGLTPAQDCIVEKESDGKVLINSRGRLTVLDTQRRTIEQAGKVIGNFDDVGEMAVATYLDDQKQAGEESQVAILLKNGDYIWIAKVKEAIDASILGAELATVLGVKVRSNRSPRLIWP
jgi:hypothetical protein